MFLSQSIRSPTCLGQPPYILLCIRTYLHTCIQTCVRAVLFACFRREVPGRRKRTREKEELWVEDKSHAGGVGYNGRVRVSSWVGGVHAGFRARRHAESQNVQLRRSLSPTRILHFKNLAKPTRPFLFFSSLTFALTPDFHQTPTHLTYLYITFYFYLLP